MLAIMLSPCSNFTARSSLSKVVPGPRPRLEHRTANVNERADRTGPPILPVWRSRGTLVCLYVMGFPSRLPAQGRSRPLCRAEHASSAPVPRPFDRRPIPSSSRPVEHKSWARFIRPYLTMQHDVILIQRDAPSPRDVRHQFRRRPILLVAPHVLRLALVLDADGVPICIHARQQQLPCGIHGSTCVISGIFVLDVLMNRSVFRDDVVSRYLGFRIVKPRIGRRRGHPSEIWITIAEGQIPPAAPCSKVPFACTRPIGRPAEPSGALPACLPKCS